MLREDMTGGKKEAGCYFRLFRLQMASLGLKLNNSTDQLCPLTGITFDNLCFSFCSGYYYFNVMATPMSLW